MALSPELQAALDTNKFILNGILQINGEFYGEAQPDSGLVIDADKVGVINNISINGLKVDLRTVQSSISTLNFELLDKNQVITRDFATNTTIFQNVEVKFFLGVITGSMDFSKYELLAQTRVTNMRRVPNAYLFSSKEAVNLLQTEINTTKNQLDGDITDVASSLTLVDSTSFPSSGEIKINKEVLTFATNVANVLGGLVRSTDSSTADKHSDGDDVILITGFRKDAKAMDILLDVIENDAGVPIALIDTPAFTTLRDVDFNGEENFKLPIFNVPNALKFIQEHLLKPTNTRLFTKNGKISI